MLEVYTAYITTLVTCLQVCKQVDLSLFTKFSQAFTFLQLAKNKQFWQDNGELRHEN